MTESFKPNSLTINKLLTDSDSFYKIPKYQRPYKWVDEHIDTLWDDLWESYENNTTNYFLGSVITAKAQGEQYLDVVDGQQRLTTLIILMAVVRDLFPDINSDDSSNISAIELSHLQNSIMRDGRFERLRLVTHQNHQSSFDSIIVKGDTTNIKKPFKKDLKKDESPEFKFQNTAYLFREKLHNIGIEEAGKFINYIYNNVYIIRIDCSDVSFAIKLFQVLNARGLDLTNADLNKSFLLGNLHKLYKEDEEILTQKESQFLNDWNDVEKIASRVGQSANDLLVMYEYYLLASNPKKSLYDELVIQFRDKDPISELIDFRKFCELYETQIVEIRDNIIYSFNYLPWTIYWKTILLTALHTGYPEYDELKKAVRDYYYQHWIAGDTLTKVKQTSFNLIKFIKEKKQINEIKRELAENQNEGIKIRMRQSLEDDVYTEAWCKPVLFIIEYHQQDNPQRLEIGNNSIQIEHILPQNFEKLYGWKEVIEGDEGSKLLNKIGNLTLLSGRKNIKASDKPFKDKIKVYQGKGLYNYDNEGVTSFRITQKIVDDYNANYNDQKWNAISIHDRQEWMIDQIKRIFNIEF